MNIEESNVLTDIYACQSLSQVNLYFIHNFKKNEALRNILPEIRDDFLQFLISGSSMDTLNEFIERLVKIDPKQAKKIVESVPAGIIKQVISQEEETYKILNLFNLLVHTLYALAFFKSIADFDILRKKKFSVHEFSRLYGFLYYVKKIDNTYKVLIDFEILSNAVKNADVNALAVDINGALITSKEFLENFFGVIEAEKIISSPQLTLQGMEKFLDTVYETDHEMLNKIVKENISIIHAKLRECLASQTEDAGKLVDFMYKAAPKYAEEIVEKEVLKSLISSELLEIHEAADFVMILIKRNPSFGKEFVPDILRSRAFLHFFNYDEYLKITDVRQKLKLLHSTLEVLFKENRERHFFYFFSYFARSELIKIASEGCGSVKLVFPEFLDIQLEEHFDSVFSTGDEALDFNLREMDGSRLEIKEEILLDVQIESENGEGMEIFFERLHEASNKIEEKFKMRHAEYFLKPDTAEKLAILADLFAAMYARHFLCAEVPYEELIEELGKLAEKIKIDF